MSPRVAICGGADLRAAAAVLGLEPAENGRADLVLVDLRDGTYCALAAAIDTRVPRVVVADEQQRALAAALGYDAAAIATSCDPAALGPLVVGALPRAKRRSTRVVVATAVRGGVGRTLLIANLARRLAARLSVAAIDATGSGALGWWLACAPRPWTELEGLADELTAEHLAIVAADAGGARVIGGAASAPTSALAASAVRAAASLAEIVLVDAPALGDERARALASLADRVLLLSYDDAPSIASLDAAEVPAEIWLVASQARQPRVGEREAFRALPRDEPAVASAIAERRGVGGALGRAYDELAELIAIDAA
ncbi:MAG TPA: hypothetical protein VGQ86_03670 [Candidatus Limnocylindria bacterium]|nr:hypothetical protein [Candidatus Limnocylindria bacterium]